MPLLSCKSFNRCNIDCHAIQHANKHCSCDTNLRYNYQSVCLSVDLSIYITNHLLAIYRLTEKLEQYIKNDLNQIEPTGHTLTFDLPPPPTSPYRGADSEARSARRALPLPGRGVRRVAHAAAGGPECTGARLSHHHPPGRGPDHPEGRRALRTRPHRGEGPVLP